MPADLRAVVVLLADGLGWHQLVDTDVAPMLSAAARASAPIRGVLPTTTATNLVSLGTGLPAGRHGVLGYTMVLDDAVFNPLVWRFGLRGGGADARVDVVPESLVPEPTMFERLAAAEVATSVVVHPDFLDSGLTRAGMRGGRRLAAVGAEATLATALAATAGPGPAVVYAHHPDIDRAGHVHGPHTPDWRDAVRRLDGLLDGIRGDLPPDVAVVVTADHGMVAVPDDDVLELHDDHPLLDGVALVAGEPRLRTLVLDDPDTLERVVARFADALGDRAVVVATRDAVGQGWFGPEFPERHTTRLGDVLVASRVGSVAHRRVDPHGGRLAGLHGSLTAAERDVPFFVLTRD
nr:nucleotide pyrophosphatase/phosphodiesterase family protein [Salsipaludibacter albus]